MDLFEQVWHCLGAPLHWGPRTNCPCCPSPPPPPPPPPLSAALPITLARSMGKRYAYQPNLLCLRCPLRWVKAGFLLWTSTVQTTGHRKFMMYFADKKSTVGFCFISCYCIVVDNVTKEIGFHGNAPPPVYCCQESPAPTDMTASEITCVLMMLYCLTIIYTCICVSTLLSLLLYSTSHSGQITQTNFEL